MSLLSPTDTLLEINGVTKSFGGLKAVNNCSMNVKKGSITGLIGPNGAGKTTLFNVITGQLPADEGNIIIDGENIEKLPPYITHSKGIVRTFQIPREMKRMTVLENLMLVKRNQSGENLFTTWLNPWKVKAEENLNLQKAEETLDFLRLSHLADEYAGNLSTGQKKLLEIGRTLMSDPKIILLDEPAAGVNPTLMNNIVDRIKEISNQYEITFLIIEHNMEIIMNLCDPIIVMSYGSKLAEGNAKSIRNNKDVIDAYLGK
ncbi:ABC transporter ATP-binding protein [Chloroflexi bacterium]|nr:ABC transporter ATP-binding protein [Chloroflexota bacterium]MDC0047298.1 ABC transporter ATP-binding protein [Chloroflexota bacterium]|tara:strand:+ start:393 stop:1172 length:780 start_codon:yes stop_codon:yes gene_type:complete